MADRTNPPSTDWLHPPEEQEGLQRYVETIRERLWLIVVTVAITTGIAILYVATAAKTYEGEADLLITPVAGDDPVFASLGLIRESADPTRDVETASRLVTNIDVANMVRKELAVSDSAQELLKQVTAEPVAQSNIVAVTAKESSREEARQLANAFAEQAVANHTADIDAQIERQIPLLEGQIGQAANPIAGDASIADIVAQLRLIQSGPAPDFRVQTLAPLPTTQASPRPVASIVAGIFAGLVLGVAAAFAAQALDPRLRREAQLRRLYRLPVLGRIPKESHSGDGPLSPRRASVVTGEAYRTLRATLTRGQRQNRGRVILVTGSGASEGKTTTAVNLAASLALAGKSVILIESDLRRPVLGATLGAQPRHGGVVSVLVENTSLDDALVPTESYGANLRLLLADYEGGWIAELFSISAAERMIEDSRQRADYVIIDSPPLNDVVDALPLARLADEVLVVVKLGTTRLDKLAQLGELLAENGVRPVGFAVVGTARPKRNGYHYYADGHHHESGGRSLRTLLSSRPFL